MTMIKTDCGLGFGIFINSYKSNAFFCSFTVFKLELGATYCRNE